MPAHTQSGRPGARSRAGLLMSVASALRTALRPGTPGLAERGRAVPRLARAVLRGDYAEVTRGHLGMLVLAALYVVSPVDLVPEGVLGLLGLADDAIVVTWLAASLVHDTEGFLSWERSRAARAHDEQTGRPGPHDAWGQPQDAPHPAGRSTVRGRVVR
ncbi:MAG: YkvA family protein [Actinomycetota bacterium]|nr:YkvA family protein [Actinomycetota bacterium]